MENATGQYDCIILGSGFVGAAAALTLSRCDLKVLVVEAKSHPRFAIGESLLPTTTRGLEYLARTYDVPELAQITHYLGLREAGCTGWPKQGFWFGYSDPGEEIPWGHQLMYISPGLPDGPDVHLLRSDSDAYLVSRFDHYGVAYRDNTEVQEIEIDDDAVTVHVRHAGGSDRLRGRYLFDCSGFGSRLARQLGLRDAEPKCRTNTRTLFSHFRDVPYLEDVMGHTAPIMVNSRDVTTIHHCFHGGWIWMIRFDNGVVSVGLTLDRDVHPDNDEPAESEFWSIVRKYPTISRCLDGATAIRPFVKTGRIQYTSSGCFGDRVALAPHAASFLDALLSTGMNISQAFLSRFVPRLRDALRDDDLSAGRFVEVDAAFRKEIEMADLLIHGMFLGFRHFELLKQYWRTLVYASVTQYLTQASVDPAGRPLALYGGSLAGWRTHLDAMYNAVREAATGDPIEGARKLKAVMDACDEPFAMDWSVEASEPTVTPLAPRLEWYPTLVQREAALRDWGTTPGSGAGTPPGGAVMRGFAAYRQRVAASGATLEAKYEESKRTGTSYWNDVDFIRKHQFYALDAEAGSQEPSGAGATASLASGEES